MRQLAIQFMIRFTPDSNPPRYTKAFTESFYKDAIERNGLRCFAGGQGGSATVYGILYKDEPHTLRIEDRDKIAEDRQEAKLHKEDVLRRMRQNPRWKEVTEQ